MTYFTSKGEKIESSLTDAEAAHIIGMTDPVGFAYDLVVAFSKGRLSERQRPWLHKLALERSQPRPEPVAVELNLEPIVALLDKASARLRYPKLWLDTDDVRIRLSVAGPNSRYAGDVMVTDGGPFGNNVWYGRITRDGKFVGSRAATQEIMDTLVSLAADPTSFARLYGQRTGSCCFCGRELSTNESLHVGYGPVCADKWGLPWGDVPTTVEERAEEVRAHVLSEQDKSEMARREYARANGLAD
jgi:hypothetical protein